MTSLQSNDKTRFLPGEHVEVLLPRPFDHGFDYLIPEEMTLTQGDYVLVPFGSKEMTGVVWGRGQRDVLEGKCKAVLAHHDAWPAMTCTLRQLIEWASSYTLAPKGLVLKMAIPIPDALTQLPSETRYRLQHVEAGAFTPARKSVIEALHIHDALSASALKRLSGTSSAVLAGMVKLGMLRKESIAALPARPPFMARQAPTLRNEQTGAATHIHEAMGNGFKVFALEGVTGSGKTEVYFDAIERLLAAGEGQTLVLLPEIALTTQWMERFEARFGDQALLWHSSISVPKRKAIWQSVANGTAPLVVGARSALFLPYRNLRLIIVDEEHEATYKQEEGVLYQARDMAVARAKCEAIPIVLCSATLSLETRQNAAAGKYTLLELRERHGAYHEPIPELIDLRADKPVSGSFIAPSLRIALAETLAAGHQSMLFLNRRGYAPLLLCRSCGHRFDCPNCSAWMVQHTHPPRLQCHHCDWRMSLPEKCPACEGEELVPCGPGVERIAEEVQQLFPDAKSVLLSSDASGLDEQLKTVISGQADIIIGTQMIAKGHHFPQLALVGVIDGDLGLDGGDLRAGERTYQLLHQLGGRAGREDTPGRVLIQTSQPEHPLMQAIAAADREGFMAAELHQREQGSWPPYGRLAGLLLEGVNEKAVREASLAYMQAAPRYENIAYLGPAPAPIARARNKYRYRILVKAPKQTDLSAIMRGWMTAFKAPSSVKVKVDIDPYGFL